MRKVILVSFILIFLIVLSEAKLELHPEIYLRDLYDFTTGSFVNMNIQATIRLEMLGAYEKEFNEKKDGITQILTSYFDEIKNIRYEEDRTRVILTGYYVADVEIPVSTNESLKNRIFMISSQRDGSLIMVFNREIFEGLSKKIAEKNVYLKLEDMVIQVTLINDLRKDVDIEVQGVYANNKPYPFTKKFTLKHREKLVITFSNVLRDYMVEEGKTTFVRVYW